MKQALLLTLEYPPQIGGVGNYYAHIVEHMPKGSVRVIDNRQHQLLSTTRFVWPKWLRALRTLYSEHKAQPVECVLVGHVLPLGVVALLARLCFGLPYIVMTHGMDVTIPFSAQGKWRHRVLLRVIFRYAQAVITVSRFTADQLLTIGVPEDRIVIISPCPSITSETESVAAEDLIALNKNYHIGKAPVLFAAGRHVVRKGFDQTIRAFELFAQEVPEAILVLAGEGPDTPRVQELIAQSSVAQRIRYVGRVTNHELAMWYTRCTAYVMPSRTLSNGDVEGFGITYLEANAFGKPVIAGHSGGVADAVVDGKTGFLIDPNDTLAIAKAMKILVTDVEKTRILGAYASERVRIDFQWQQRAEQLISCIEKYA